MITKSEAESIVQKWLDEHKLQSWHQGQLQEEAELAISRVDEHPWGWMFSYQSKKFLETGDPLDALAGNCPVYVTRDDGAFHEPVTGSFASAAEHLRIFEARLKKKS
jgi:hypothetical protein